MKVEAVMFDFSGVLSDGRFYSGLKQDNPELYTQLKTEIFAPPSTLCDRWMRNEINHQEINRHLSQKFNIPEVKLNHYLLDSVQKMPLDQDLIAWAKELRQSGRPTAIVTDNMDTFSAYTVPALGLDKIFPVIVNSADHGVLKKEKDLKLFKIALEKLGKPDLAGSLLIDDSRKTCDLFRQAGGQAVVYNELADINPWRDKI